MHSLSNPNRLESAGEEPGKIRNPKSFAENKSNIKDLIAKANSVPLSTIFKYYGLNCSEHNKKINCPFSSRHSNGIDRTPSFEYYPHTNTFYCHGCKANNRPCNFVALREGITVTNAAFKILNLHESEATFDESENNSAINYPERIEILMEFSNIVREFIQSNNNNSCLEFIESVTLVFDQINLNHTLDNVALKNVVEKLKRKVSNYKPCPQL